MTSSRPSDTVPEPPTEPEPQPATTTEPAPAGPVRFSERYVLALLSTFATLLFGIAARLRLQLPPFGDEPHYLILNEAMLRYHTVDPTLAYAHGDYRSFYPALLEEQLSKLPDGTPVPLHNAGGPLLWMPAYLAGGRGGVAAFLVVVSVLIVLNLYWLLRGLGIGRPYATIVTALFAIGSPIYVYSAMLFVESIGTLIVLFAARQVLAPKRSPVRLIVASAGLGYLPFIHGRFVIFTLLVGALLAVRVFAETTWRAWRPYLYAIGPLVLIGGAVVVFNMVQYGTPNPAPGNANMGAGLLRVPPHQGLLSLLFDRYYGLLPYFPIFLLVFPGILLSLRRGLAWVHVTILGIAVPYLVAVSTFNFWWGGFSPPARFLTVVAPLLGYYVAVTLQRLHAWWATAVAMLAAVAAYMVSLAGDIEPTERFDSGAHGKVMLIDRVGHLLFGYPYVDRLLPSILHSGANRAKFAACAAVVAVVTVAVWLIGRRRPAARIPVPELPRVPLRFWR